MCKTVWVKSSPIDQKGQKWTTIVFIWWIGDYVIWWTYPRNSNKLLGGFEMEWTPKRLLVIDFGQIGLHIWLISMSLSYASVPIKCSCCPRFKVQCTQHTAESGFLNIVLIWNYEQPRKEILMCCPDKCRNSQVDGFVGPRKKRGDGQNGQKERDT